MPRVDLGDEDFTLANSAIQTLTAQYADLDFNHVEPARMFRRIMKFQALKNAVCLGCREGFVQGSRRVSERLSITTRIRSASG